MKTLKLKKPIQVSAQAAPITELNFREEVTAGDVRGIKLKNLQDPSGDDYMKIASRLCGKTDLELNALSFDDYADVLVLVDGFLKPGPSTTPTSL